MVALLPLSQAEELVLIDSILRGEDWAIPYLAEWYAPMAKRLGEKIGYTSCPHKRDDLQSVAYVGLMTGLHWASTGRLKDHGLEAYLYSTCRRFISDYLETDHTVNIPRKAWKQQRVLGMDLTAYMEICEEETPDSPAMVLEDDYNLYAHLFSEFGGLFTEIGLTTVETTVAFYRIMDWTQAKIGEHLHKTQQAIAAAEKRIAAKLTRFRESQRPVVRTCYRVTSTTPTMFSMCETNPRIAYVMPGEW